MRVRRNASGNVENKRVISLKFDAIWRVLSELLKVGLLILNELNGEILAKYPIFFIELISLFSRCLQSCW